ncbi:MAG: sugar ABC transporter permease [Planctomycetota bacterium]
MTGPRDRSAPWMAVPALAVVAAVVLVPSLLAVWRSLERRDLVSQEAGFAGGANYAELAHDSRALASAGRSLLFAGVTVPIEAVLGLSLALLLAVPFRGRGPMRAVMLVPWVLPSAIMAMAWALVFHDSYGPFGDLLARAGLAERGVAWLGRPVSAFLCAAAADVWKTTPFVAVILLAGLQTIPRDLYDAIEVDGGGPWHRFRHVTLPLLRPYLAVAISFRAIQALGVFDLLWVLTKGGPAGATETLALYLYTVVYRYGRIGYGSALTVALASLMLLAGLGLSALIRRRR